MARILIADDEKDLRELIAFTLRFAGHDVIAASNGEEALHTTCHELPDLVLLDVRMPRMTGYETCERIKADPTTAHIPVVFLSAKSLDSELKTGLSLGAVDYIVKPFSPDQLMARVAELLSRAGNQVIG